MILYFNKNNNKLTKDTSVGIPINITTDIYLPIYETTNIVDRVINNGEYTYVDKNGQITDNEISIIKSEDKVIPNKTINMDMSDEYIYTCRTMVNKPYKSNIKKYHTVKVTEENYDKFDIKDIFHNELINLLNDSRYDSIANDFMNEVQNDSSYDFMNKYIIILDKSDYLHIKIDDITPDEICIGNIDTNLSVYVNTNTAYKIDNTKRYFKLQGHNKLDINIINNTNKKINIVNMFIMY